MGSSDILGYICPVCNTPNPSSVKYCVKCGHWLLDTTMEAKPLTKKEFKKYFYERKMSKQTKGFLVAGLLLLAAIYLLGSANAKMFISLLIILGGIISIIKPLSLIGISSRLRGLATIIIGIVVLFISAQYLPHTTPTITKQSLITPAAASFNPAEFKAQCTAISYDDLARLTENYIGKKTTFTGMISSIQEISDTQIVMLIGVTKGQFGIYSNAIWVNYVYQKGQKRFLQNDIVDLWGTVEGRKTYTAVNGQQVTVPELDASIIEIAQKPSTQTQ